ncbi:29072_t:CDS:2 [Racocetra persica]|uniref:29072_t:CDS:1 n=1 Tax=Racocetra persica TaxID=160502 RepID=A0ACA9RN82_9GLOM|nr:29072_t:CDS:2 [Racocetra persica]
MVWSRITSSEDFCWATPPQKSIKYTINWVDRSSPPSSPVLEPKEDKVSSPTQGNSSVSEYIKMIKLYAISVGKDLDDIDVKEKFLVGLSPDNEKRVEDNKSAIVHELYSQMRACDLTANLWGINQ